MNDVFISYSSKDESIARHLHNTLKGVGIDAFLATISIRPGENSAKVIFENLKNATWVFFLATKNSCESQAVQQELGASLAAKKVIIPLLVDISPEELPGWVNRYHAIDIHKAPDTLHSTIAQIAKKLKADKFWLGVTIGALVTCLLFAKNK